MLFVVLAVVQSCLVLAAVNSADAAARAGARSVSRGQDPGLAVQAASTPWLRPNTTSSVDQGVTVVHVQVPALIPALNLHLFNVTRRAWLPGS
jgi:hypothetical protein